MSVISLLTDFGLKDNFAGVIKAVILRINPRAKIVDICHQVSPQDIIEAAFLLQGSCRYFPSGTIHLAVIDPGVGSRRKKVIVRARDYYFVGPDNGIFAPALRNEKPKAIIELTNDKYFLKPASDTFQGRDIFAPVAAYLSKGVDIGKFGRKIKAIQGISLPQIKKWPRTIAGEIVHIDRFGNLISNIDKDTLIRFIKNIKFKVCIKGQEIYKLSHSYSESPARTPLALIDSFNYLEIAINCGSACDYLQVEKGARITVSVA